MLNKLKIGNVELNNNIILGPMAGLTDRPFRIICEKFNPGLVVTEMCSSKALMYNDNKTKLLLNTTNEKRPVAVQIFGSDAYSIAFATKYINDRNLANIIDINMGCPAPKVVKNGDGSKLLLEPEKVYEITKSAVENSNIPITVKIRTGWDSEHITAVEVAKNIERAGASAITIHGRTRSQFYSGEVKLSLIKEVKEAVKIPVIGNGDICNFEDAERMFKETNCDGIMISRASLGNPWIFENMINQFEDKQIRKISNEEKLQIILEHIELEIKEKGEYTGIREMRKHLSYYIRGEQNASEIRKKINRLETKKEKKKTLKEYFLNL